MTLTDNIENLNCYNMFKTKLLFLLLLFALGNFATGQVYGSAGGTGQP